MKLIRGQGKILVNALPQESVIANVIRRILKIIREVYDTILSDDIKSKINDGSPIDVRFLDQIQNSLTPSKYLFYF